MATLQTIRNRGGLLVSIVIGLALIAFIVGDALNSGSRIFNSQRNQIGEIAGEGVSIIDFQNRVSKNEEMIKAMNNVSSLNEEQQKWVTEAGKYSSELQWDYDQEYADKCRAELEKDGATFTDIDTTEWIAVVEPILTEIADKLGVTDGYEAIKNMK